MNEILLLIEELTLSLDSTKNLGKLKSYTDRYYLPIEESMFQTKQISFIDNDIIEFYKTSNGFNLSWKVDLENGIGGNMRLLKLEDILYDRDLSENQVIEENKLIRNFHPIDLFSPEAQCGIMIGLDYQDNEIYLNYSPMIELYGLDLDFIGYMQMAIEAKVYFHWQSVLLDLQKEEESLLTKNFKQNMPNIFPEFNWNQFVNKYESLRLSKKK